MFRHIFVYSPKRKTKLLRNPDGRFRRAAVFDDETADNDDNDSDDSDMVSLMSHNIFMLN